MKKLNVSIPVIALLITMLSCRNSTPESNGLGTIAFKATGKAAAQPAFQKGMLLLHSFEYDDAAELFAEAIRIDPGFVMAYWGEAMTYNHPLWQEQDMDAGRKILAALDENADKRVNKAATVLEQDFMRGVNILFGPGDKQTRDSSYAAFMQTLYGKYPGNDEVASFYSLALNAWGYASMSDEILEKAADIGFEVMKRNPEHPGAIHYIIHAYDNPKYADKALQAADDYAVVAPAAGHALHMPTHIYTALGIWDKVVSSNITSWQAEMARKERKALDNDALGYHSYHWLQYGLLQQGNYTTALQMADSMRLFCEQLPSKRARNHLIYLQTSYLGEKLDYTTKSNLPVVDHSDLNITTRAAAWFASGMHAYQTGDKASLHQSIQHIQGAILVEGDKESGSGLRICGNISRSQATETDVQLAGVILHQLQAQEAQLAGNKQKYEDEMNEAIALHAQVGNQPGPPIVTIPPHEMYGRWLMEENRLADAKLQFEQALRLKPNRLHAKQGIEACVKLASRQHQVIPPAAIARQ